MNWLKGKLLWLHHNTWFYWKLSFPVTPGRAIRDRLARRAEEKALSASLPNYRYRALHGSDSIRLLKIDAPPRTGIFGPGLIRCTMQEVPVADAPPYRALSYTWKEDELMLDWGRKGRHLANPIAHLYGSKRWKAFVRGGGFPWLGKVVARLATATAAADFDPDVHGKLPRRLIICDGRAILVTQNLHGALNAVMRLYPGYWWIDQLCINQDDVQERNAQVALMGQLYRNASQVVVWLGERTRLEARAVAALERMASMSDDVEEMVVISGSLFGRDMSNLFGMAGFFSRSWFDRLWIVQEFAVARQATFLLGDAEIPLETATRALRRLEQILSASSFAVLLVAADIPTETRSGLLDTREYTTANGEWSPEKWLSVARGRKTTDARDYVFGGLSLLGREKDQKVPDIPTEPVFVTRNDTTMLGTDYSKSVEAVYYAFSLALFSSDLGLNALSLVGIKRDLKQFPSWMANLHHPLSPKPLHQLQMRRTRVRSTNSGHRPSRVAEMYLSGEVAVLEAVHFDEIHAVGEPLGHWVTGLDSDRCFHLADTFRLCLELGPHYQHTGELSLVALWRTLILEADSSALPSLDASFSDAVRWYFDPERPALRNQDVSKWKSAQNHQEAQDAHAALHTALFAMLSGDEYRETAFAKAMLPAAHRPEDMRSEKGLNDPALWYDTWLAFFEAFHEAAPGRRLFVTRRGYLGMAPASAQPGDEVMFVRGAWAPYVFRLADTSKVDHWDADEKVHILIGEAYVHGVMDKLDSDESVLAAAGADVFPAIWLV